MSQAKFKSSIEAEQIDIIQNQPTLKLHLEQNYDMNQNELQSVKTNKKEAIFFKDPKRKDQNCLLNLIIIKQIESKQLAKSIHASHQLGGVFLFIVTAIKLLGLYKFTASALIITILIVISSLFWIISVAIGTIGIIRNKYNPLIFYILGIIISFIIEFSSTIVILATNHIADHQLGLYNKNVIIRMIVFMTLEFMVILFQIMMIRSVSQIRQLFIQIEILQIENQSHHQIEIDKML